GVLGVIVAYRLVDKVQAITAVSGRYGAQSQIEEDKTEFDEELSLSSQNPMSSSCANMAMVNEEQDNEASNKVAELIGGQEEKVSTK
ncbi:MATE family efflux transporter, partial [Shewanella sp. 0m-11]